MNERNALLIATRKFWPINSGKDLTLYYNCKGLSEKYGYNVFVYCLDSGIEGAHDVPDFIRSVMFSGEINLFKRVANVLRYSLFGEQWPLQTAIYYSERIAKELHKYYLDIEPSVVFVDMLRLASYGSVFANDECKKILIIDDDLAKRYRRQMAAHTSASEVSGTYSSKLPGVIRRFLKFGIVKKAILKFEAPRIEKAEKNATTLYDFVTFISPMERDEFRIRNHSDKAILLTVGTELGKAGRGNKIKSIENTLSYVGNFDVAANIDSLMIIADKLLDRLRDNVVLHVIGKYPHTLAEKFRGNPKIKLLGRVEDLAEAVLSTAVYLAPIAYGTGIKTKIIEAMGFGMPVVTNSIGAEGIAAKNGEDFFVTDDFGEMAVIVERLLDEPALCEKVGENAQKFISENHTWDRVYRAFGEMGL